MGKEEQDNPSFYKTVTSSKEWKEWEKHAHKKFFDWGESTECGWLSSSHFKAFLEFVKNGDKYVFPTSGKH